MEEPASAGVLEQAASAGVLEQGLDRMNAWLAEFEPVLQLTEKCGVQPWVVVGGGGLVLGFVMWGLTGELLCITLGCLYPMYASFRALDDGDPKQVSRWLIYWVVFAAYLLTDSMFHMLLCWIPFYSILRLVLIVWLFMPTGGADCVYNWVLRPILRKYRESIDVALDPPLFRGSSGLLTEMVAEELTKELTKGATEGLRKVAAAGAAALLEQRLSASSAGSRKRVASPAPLVRPAQPAEPAPEPPHSHEEAEAHAETQEAN